MFTKTIQSISAAVKFIHEIKILHVTWTFKWQRKINSQLIWSENFVGRFNIRTMKFNNGKSITQERNEKHNKKEKKIILSM